MRDVVWWRLVVIELSEKIMAMMERIHNKIFQTEIFKTGNSQAVRIPRNFGFKGKKVLVSKQGKSLVLTPIEEHSWGEFFQDATEVPQDFMAFNRGDEPQNRDLF